MIEIEKNYYEEAYSKINADMKTVKGNKARVMAPCIAAALSDFSRQDNEFAKAVVIGGSFADCMAEVGKGVGNAISDIDAIRKAVEFYFKGAVVNFTMTIQVNPYEVQKTEQEKPKKKSSLSFSLDDLL